MGGRTSGTRIGNGAGRGDGWGGPAKGAGQPAERAPAFMEGNTASVGRPQPDTERIETLRQKLYDLATGADRQETQLSAAVALLNRLEGMPTARTQIGGPDDGPIPFVMFGAQEAATEEEWQQANPPPT